MLKRVLVLIGLVAVLLLVLAPTALAEIKVRDDDAVVLTGTVNVAEGEKVDTVVAFDGPATIEGEAENVVAFNGDITITGVVHDTAIAFNGRVYVEEGAMVHGDVYSRYTPSIDPDAEVSGAVDRFNFDWFDAPFAAISRYAWWLAVSVSTLVLGGLLLLLGPKALDGAVSVGRGSVGPAIGMGLALFIGLPILSILLIATLVGIPFGLGLMFSLALIYAVGYVVSAWFVGRLIVDKRGRGTAFLAGWAILRIVALVPVLGGIMWFAATVFGLGILMVETWRARSTSVVTTPAVIAG